MQHLFPVYVREKRAQWLVFLLAWLTLGCLGGYWIYHERELTLSREKEKLLHHVRLIEANLIQQLQSINSALVSVRPDTSSLAQRTHGTNDLSLRLRTLSDAMPGVRSMLVINQAGVVSAASIPEALGLDVSDRAYFKVAQGHTDADALYVSEPFVSKINPIYSLNLVKTWVDETQAFAGIITATLDPAYFEVLLRSVLYADDMRSAMVHGDGKVFMTLPANPAITPANLSGTDSVFRAHLDMGVVESFHVAQGALTGDERLVAYRTVLLDALHMDRPLVLAVSRNVQAVLAPWRLVAGIFVLTYCLLGLVGVVGLWLLQRKQGELTKLSRALAQESLEHVQWLNIALAAGDLGLIDLDLTTGLRKVNARAQEMVGNGPDEPVDTFLAWLDRMHQDDRAMASAVHQVLPWDQSDTWSLEYRIRHTAGHWVWIHCRGRFTERSADGTPLRMIGIYQDITVRKADAAQLAEFAFLDMLTQLPNRRLLMDRLAHAQAASARSRKPVALLFMDLDHFKWVNDTLGHATGDLVLQQVASRLRRCVRQSDTVARLGGDEFVVVLNQLGDTAEEAQANAIRMADKIQTALREPMRLSEHPCSVTSSIGITLFCGDAVPVDQLLKQADSALYQAKANGRDCAVVYSSNGVLPGNVRTELQ